jgi:tRNA G18 (ribose-2'-O)-methylase SpoU
MQKIVCIFHNVRSAHNVGAMFRTAECAGVGRVYLTGYTPAPINRFGFAQKEVAKSALGAELLIPWESRRQIAPVIASLRADGYTIVAVEQSATSKDYRTVKSKKVALIMGNEVTGLSTSVLKKADITAEIGLKGTKESLNVATAFGIVLFRVAGL